jgi:hypothetical protein
MKPDIYAKNINAMAAKHSPRPVGRPSLYRPEYCAAVESFMADGFSLTAFAGSIGVTRATLHEWKREHPEFFDAISRGKAKQLLWWERAAQNVASGNGGPGASSMVMFCLRNIDSGEWKDTRELRHAGPNAEPVRTIDATMTAQEAIEAYQAMLRASQPVMIDDQRGE